MKKESIPWIALNELNELPDWKNSILITTQTDLNKFQPIIHYAEILILPNIYTPQAIEEIFLSLLKCLNQVQEVKSVLIAIDPGLEQTGVALFINDKFFISEVFYGLPEIMDRIRIYLQFFGGQHRNIKIGNGYARNTRYLLNYFFSENFIEKNVDFFLVNENASSHSNFEFFFRNLTQHEKAAITIAQRQGRQVNKHNIHALNRVTIPKSAIRGIQSEFRRIAKKHKKEFTIKSERAKEIYLGKKSIKESFEDERG